MKAGDLVWIDRGFICGPALLFASDAETISATMSPCFSIYGLNRKYARIIATADEIKQRNKERK